MFVLSTMYMLKRKLLSVITSYIFTQQVNVHNYKEYTFWNGRNCLKCLGYFLSSERGPLKTSIRQVITHIPQKPTDPAMYSPETVWCRFTNTGLIVYMTVKHNYYYQCLQKLLHYFVVNTGQNNIKYGADNGCPFKLGTNCQNGKTS